MPIIGLINEKLEKNNYLMKIISENLGVDIEDIIDFDLCLYEYDKGCIFGVNDEFISTGRLDDLWMVYAGVKAIEESSKSSATKVLLCLDNEEIGSLTSQGANSDFTEKILERIVLSFSSERENFFRTISNSTVISSDLAHAVHPNNIEKHDPTNRPVLGKGPVLKIAASGSYSTEGYSGAIFKMLCKKNNIPYQIFVNRSDVRGGGTIGPILASKLGIPVIDMGAPILGMHSIRELAEVNDNINTMKLFRCFYS